MQQGDGTNFGDTWRDIMSPADIAEEVRSISSAPENQDEPIEITSEDVRGSRANMVALLTQLSKLSTSTQTYSRKFIAPEGETITVQFELLENRANVRRDEGGQVRQYLVRMDPKNACVEVSDDIDLGALRALIRKIVG
ncbi:hypothetical protein JW758_01170 [Candidatus Peregrinibacteria bacterium]|nr:hypothetical protein [Candidatus Peregrinibacteria bacterium]